MEGNKREEGRHEEKKAERDRRRRSMEGKKEECHLFSISGVRNLWGKRKAYKGSNGKRRTLQVDTQHQRHLKPSVKTSLL